MQHHRQLWGKILMKNENKDFRKNGRPVSASSQEGSKIQVPSGTVGPATQKPAQHARRGESPGKGKPGRTSQSGEWMRNAPYRELKNAKDHDRSPSEYGKALRDAREWQKASHSASPEPRNSFAAKVPDPEGRDRRVGYHEGPAERRPVEGRNCKHGMRQPGKKVEYLFEDADYIVVGKPSGLPTIAGESSREKNLYDMITEHLKKRSSVARAAVVHRLDKDTSGILVFAKHARAKKALMEDWNDRVKERGYMAIVRGSMPAEEGVLESWLLEDSEGRVREVEPGLKGALRAVTLWKTIASDGYWTLLDLRLETGRKHQIRVQLAGSGHPVAGDSKYWRSGNPASPGHTRKTGISRPILDMEDPLGRLALHAHLLCFEHPFTNELLRFESPPPESFQATIRRSGLGRAGQNQSRR